MSTTTITKKGQITIPILIRKQLSLKKGDKVAVKFEDKKAIIRKIPSIFDLRGSVPTPEEVKKLSWKEIEKKAHDNMVKKVRP